MACQKSCMFFIQIVALGLVFWIKSSYSVSHFYMWYDRSFGLGKHFSKNLISDTSVVTQLHEPHETPAASSMYIRITTTHRCKFDQILSWRMLLVLHRTSALHSCRYVPCLQDLFGGASPAVGLIPCRDWRTTLNAQYACTKIVS